jgi:hypothetical protein
MADFPVVKSTLQTLCRVEFCRLVAIASLI